VRNTNFKKNNAKKPKNKRGKTLGKNREKIGKK
jgi:hypothetical protein